MTPTRTMAMAAKTSAPSIEAATFPTVFSLPKIAMASNDKPNSAIPTTIAAPSHSHPTEGFHVDRMEMPIAANGAPQRNITTRMNSGSSTKARKYLPMAFTDRGTWARCMTAR